MQAMGQEKIFAKYISLYSPPPQNKTKQNKHSTELNNKKTKDLEYKMKLHEQIFHQRIFIDVK